MLLKLTYANISQQGVATKIAKLICKLVNSGFTEDTTIPYYTWLMMLRGLNQQRKLGGPLCRSSVEFLCVGSPASPRPRSAFSGQRDHPECSSECLQPQLGTQTSMIGMRAGLGGSRGFDEVLGRLPLIFGSFGFMSLCFAGESKKPQQWERFFLRVEIFC